MSSAPAGTVTFLFADIEGSTKRWQDEPEVMRGLLAEHDAIWHEVAAGHEGYLFKHTGDGVAIAFASPADAVAAARSAQVRLAEVVSVRIGLHAGEAELRGGDYFGAEVNRAARIMGVGHGGQIVCSGAVREQLRHLTDVVDLGEHRLRDLYVPVHLFQVDVPGRTRSFPPVRSLDSFRSNLPHQLSSFVGREGELESLAERLRSSRVVSIVGVGGVGKTRLALQIGSEVLPRYSDGVWLCELAPVLDPASLVDAIAAALGYAPPQGVPVAEGLLRFLERKSLLVVLDNCEHLLGAVGSWVSTTTAVAANVSVLATSREALGVPGEQIWPLASLGLPATRDVDAVAAADAVRLFTERATSARGAFSIDATNADAVAQLCERLDGIALAIELAAAQTKVMSPAEIVARLDKQFRLLRGGRLTSMERHQTLRAAIDWSYDLLSDEERTLFDRLSVCVGGLDLDAAAALAAGVGLDEFDAFDLLGSLVAKSLVERNERDGVTRYRMLEMVRQFAAEKLHLRRAADATHKDHARHYLDVACRLFAQTATAADYQALSRIEIETPNIAAAGRWLLDAGRNAQLVAFFDQLPFLDPFAWPATTLDELGAIAVDTLDQAGTDADAALEGACFWAGARAFMVGDLDEVRRVVGIAQQLGGDAPAAATLNFAASVALFDGDPTRVIALAEAAVTRVRSDSDLARQAFILGHLANIGTLLGAGDLSAVVAEGLAVARATASKIVLLYPLQGHMGSLSSPAEVRRAAAELMSADFTERGTYQATAQAAVASLHFDEGELAAGLEAFRQFLVSARETGERSMLSIRLGAIAEMIAKIEPAAAINLAALAESDAIAPVGAFGNYPLLSALAQTNSAEITAARDRMATLSYDDAFAFIDETIGGLITHYAADR